MYEEPLTYGYHDDNPLSYTCGLSCSVCGLEKPKRYYVRRLLLKKKQQQEPPSPRCDCKVPDEDCPYCPEEEHQPEATLRVDIKIIVCTDCAYDIEWIREGDVKTLAFGDPDYPDPDDSSE